MKNFRGHQVLAEAADRENMIRTENSNAIEALRSEQARLAEDQERLRAERDAARAERQRNQVF